MTPPCFALHIFTPTRSASGWTRGMPPPALTKRAPPGPPSLQSPSSAPPPARGPSITAPHATVSDSAKSVHRAHQKQQQQPSSSAPPPPPPVSNVKGAAAAAAASAASASDAENVTVLSYLRGHDDDNDNVGDGNGAGSAVDTLLDHLDQLDRTAAPPASGGDASSRADVVGSARERTVAVHGGERVRGPRKTKAMLDAIQIPIVQSSTFTFRSTRDCIDYNRGRYQSFEYGRYGNPTARAVEEKVAALEHADDCLISASGMNSVTTMLLALVPQGGHIVTTTDCYRRTRQFVSTLLPKMDISYTVLDPSDMTGLKATLASRDVSLYFSESPTNPLMRVVDVPGIARLCRQHGVISVFDTTFATPINLRPMDCGADLVLHSGTKYLAGHQDVMSGLLVGRQELIDRVRKLHGVLGGVIDPHAAYLINRGLKTLALRMKQHNQNAESVAKALLQNPKISRVYYPTVPSHVDHEVAMTVFGGKGFGGVLSFEVAGDGDAWSVETFEAAGRFIDALKIPYIGPSLGGCETIIEQVCIMGYFDQPLRERRRLGITNGLVRLSCGIEDTDDLVNDIDQALRYA